MGNLQPLSYKERKQSWYKSTEVGSPFCIFLEIWMKKKGIVVEDN